MKKIFMLSILFALGLSKVLGQVQTDSTNKKLPVKIIATNQAEKKPLYVLDGITKISSDFSIKNLNAEDIQEVRILKGDDAIKLFGKLGIDGVILISTKAGKNNIENTEIDDKLKMFGLNNRISSAKDFSFVPNISSDSTSKIPKNKVLLRGLNADNKAKQPIYIIDGTRIESGAINTIDANTIYSVSVVKNDNVISQYGLAAANGVVFITTKPSQKPNLHKEKSVN